MELVICAVHPIPGEYYFYWTTKLSNHGGVEGSQWVPIDITLSLPMFLRLYLICRVMLLHSKVCSVLLFCVYVLWYARIVSSPNCLIALFFCFAFITLFSGFCVCVLFFYLCANFVPPCRLFFLHPSLFLPPSSFVIFYTTFYFNLIFAKLPAVLPFFNTRMRFVPVYCCLLSIAYLHFLSFTSFPSFYFFLSLSIIFIHAYVALLLLHSSSRLSSCRLPFLYLP